MLSGKEASSQEIFWTMTMHGLGKLEVARFGESRHVLAFKRQQVVDADNLRDNQGKDSFD